jgi:hypothetical protein
MSFSNDGVTWSNWETYASSKNWELTSGNGEKNVIAKFMDNAGLTTTALTTVTLQMIQLSPTATPNPPPTVTPTQAPTASPTPNPTNQPTKNPTASPEATPDIPELPVGIVLAVFVAFTIALLTIIKRRRYR